MAGGGSGWKREWLEEGGAKVRREGLEEGGARGVAGGGRS